MTERPPPLDNGYLWLAHTLVTAADAQVLGQQLQGVRHDLRTRDASIFGDPRHDTEVELWVHPDDQGPAASILHRLFGGV